VLAGVAAHQWIALSFGIAGIGLAFTALARAAINAASGPAPPPFVDKIPHRAPLLVATSVAATLALAAGASILPWTAAGGALVAAAAVLGGGP
jgi:hypothetical protein